MRRFAVLFVPLLTLAACVSEPVPRAPVAAARQCHVAPDGGAPMADRGIGGTGAPAARRADRGIGGTGGSETRSADRGIGGTGITGIVTGFASVCVDGLEVALDDRSVVDVDGTPDSQAALRVGQWVAIKAGPPEQMPVASKVSVRHEVSGPVDAVLGVEPGLIVVAGQRVRVPGKTSGSLLVRPGVWVAVSGLRGPDGDIIASRLDARAPGRVLVHGPLILVDGLAAIGSLEIRIDRDLKAEVGTYVTALGTDVGGVLAVETLVPDLLVSDPPAWFGPRTTRLVLESYGQFASGAAAVTGGFQAGLAQGFEPPRDLSGPMVMSLEQQADGSFAVIRASPAPVPAAVGGMPGASGSYRSPGGGNVARGSAVEVTSGTVAPPGQAAGSNTQVYRLTSSSSAQASGPTPSTGAGIVYAPITVTSASRIGIGAIAATGGIRLMGAGAAGRGAAVTFAPRSFGLHLRPMRIRPGR